MANSGGNTTHAPPPTNDNEAKIAAFLIQREVACAKSTDFTYPTRAGQCCVYKDSGVQCIEGSVLVKNTTLESKYGKHIRKSHFS